MVDVFEEVEGELRADRYRQLARRIVPWVVGLLLLALAAALGIWGYGEWRERQATEASETYARALTAMPANRPEAERLFREVSGAGSPVYRALALHQLAALKVEANDPRAAVPILDQAAEAAPDDILADSARLKAALLVMDYAPAAAQERLRPLAEDGRPFQLAAREALALSHLAAGRTKEARTHFLAISQALGAPEPAQARAQAMVAAIDSGAAAQIPVLLRTPVTATAPTPPAAPAPALPGAPVAVQPAPAAPSPSPAR